MIQLLHLTHSIPLASFYTPWKHQKLDILIFSGVQKETNGMKWANIAVNVLEFFLKNKENGHGRVISKIWQISIFFRKLLHISKSTGSKVTFFEYIKNSNGISNICYNSTTEIE